MSVASSVPVSPSTRLLKGAGWTVLGNAAARGFTIATAFAAARILGRDEFGSVALTQLTVAAAANLVSLQMGQTATRFVAQYRNTSPHAVTRVAQLVRRIAWITGLAAALAVILAAEWIGRRLLGQATGTPLVRWAAPAVFLTLYSSVQLGILYGLEQFATAARIAALGYACIFVGVLLGSLRAGTTGAVTGWVLGNAVLCWLAWRALLRFLPSYGRGQLWPPISARSILLSYSTPLWIASGWISVVLLGCNALLARYHSLGEVALYSAADRLHLILLFVPSALFCTTLPVLSDLYSRGDRDGYQQVLRTAVNTACMTVLAPAVLLASFSGPILSAGFGKNFAPASGTLMLLCCASLFESSNIVLGQLFLVAGRIWARAAIDVGLGAVLLVCAVLWVPRFGSIGLAGAYALSFAAASAALALVRPRFGVAPDRGVSAHA